MKKNVTFSEDPKGMIHLDLSDKMELVSNCKTLKAFDIIDMVISDGAKLPLMLLDYARM